jgi:hypothetical protein
MFSTRGNPAQPAARTINAAKSIVVQIIADPDSNHVAATFIPFETDPSICGLIGRVLQWLYGR